LFQPTNKVCTACIQRGCFVHKQILPGGAQSRSPRAAPGLVPVYVCVCVVNVCVCGCVWGGCDCVRLNNVCVCTCECLSLLSLCLSFILSLALSLSLSSLSLLSLSLSLARSLTRSLSISPLAHTLQATAMNFQLLQNSLSVGSMQLTHTPAKLATH